MLRRQSEMDVVQNHLPVLICHPLGFTEVADGVAGIGKGVAPEDGGFDVSRQAFSGEADGVEFNLFAFHVGCEPAAQLG